MVLRCLKLHTDHAGGTLDNTVTMKPSTSRCKMVVGSLLLLMIAQAAAAAAPAPAPAAHPDQGHAVMRGLQVISSVEHHDDLMLNVLDGSRASVDNSSIFPAGRYLLALKHTRSKMKRSEAGANESEWDHHIIFNGPGSLETCPLAGGSSAGNVSLSDTSSSSSSSSSSSGWLQSSWLQQKPLEPHVQPPQAATGAQQQAVPRREAYMLPLSTQAQNAIWQNQHPANCSAATFLLYRDPAPGNKGHGIGSVLHMQTMALMVAMNTGRVLVTLPGSYLATDPYCGSNRTTLDTCYFQPLTSCAVSEEQAASAWRYGKASKEQRREFLESTAANNSFPQFVSLVPHGNLVFDKHVRAAPKQFTALLDAAGIPRKNQYYWWRAQGVAYIVRPTQQTLQQLDERKRLKLRGPAPSPGCISLYVRHGDKRKEAKLYEDPEYEQALEHLLQVDPSLTRQVFLSTDDPATVEYFTDNTRNWSTSVVDMPRKPDRNKNNVVYMKEHGFANEMLDSLLSLDLALQCDGFVSSISSNWARLIDELRSTVRCKAKAAYMDVAARSAKGLAFHS